MYVAVLIVGMVLLALGGQGAIRLLLDKTETGFLSWLPGGMVVLLIAYVAIAVAGGILASWGADRARKAGKIT